MNAILSFVAGCFVGALIGIILTCALAANNRRNKSYEEYMARRRSKP